MKKTLILTAAAALMLLGCSKEQEEVIELSHNVEGKKITVGVSFEVPETSTKSDIDDDGNFYWSVEDAILMGSDETSGTTNWGRLDIVKKSQNENFGPGKYLAEFTGTLLGERTAVAAVFPHTVTPNYTKGSSSLSLTLPDTIAWNASSLKDSSTTMQADNVMLAVYEDLNPGEGYKQGTTDDLHFYNVGGLFRLTLNKIPVGATNLVFTTDKKINGTFDVADLNPDNNNTYPSISTPDPKIEPFSEGENSTTITFQTVTEPCKKVFFIPVPVGSYQISFEVKNDKNEVLWSFGTNKFNTVLRGHMVKMPTLTFTKISGGGDGATNIIVTPTGFSGTVNLPSTNSSIYVKMNETTGGTINLEYSQSEGALKPENVYLQALGDIKALNINLPESHVELTGEENVHTITNVNANTSISTFVVDSNVKIGKDDDATTGLTIKGGSLNLQAPTQKVTIDIPESAANKTAHKVQININSTIKTLAVERAAYTEKVADKIYVKLAPPVSETPTAITVEGINVKEKNCNLWVAKGVTVTSSVETKAAENTVAGEVATLTATDEGTIVNVTSEATVSQTSAANGATVIVEKGATVTNTNDNNGSGTIITGVDSESVAIFGSNSYKTLTEAVAAAADADSATITIIKEGDYTLPAAIANNLTIVGGVEGVNVNHTGASAVTTITSGKTLTLKNIALNLDKSFYQGFGTSGTGANAGALVMENCSIDGSLSLFGVSTFKNCTFTANDANAGAYNIWAVYSDATFTGCSFTNTNRAVNVYDPVCGSTRKTVTFTNCSFTASEKKKAAINIHHNPAPVQASGAKFDVVITNCTTSGTWASSVAETGEPADATICNSALWMVSDIENWTNGDITVNGVNVYDAPVAQIGTTTYTTLEGAVAAAQSDDTITLISDVDLSSHARSASDDIILEGVTLDLNGKTIRGYNSGVRYSGTGAVIKNGTFGFVDSEQKPNYGLSIGSYTAGATISDNITLENIKVVGGINIDLANVTMNNVDINMTDATFYAIWVDEDGAVATYNSGTINGGANATAIFGVAPPTGDAKDAIRITGGTVKTNGKKFRLTDKYLPVEVSGGLFDVRVPADCCAEGYEPTTEPDANGMYTVTPAAPKVAKIGDVKYGTLAEAIAAVQDGKTITLLSDVNLSGDDKLWIDGKNYTVDGDEKTINTSSCTNPYALCFENGTYNFSNVTFESTNPDNKQTYHIFIGGGKSTTSGTFSNVTITSVKETSLCIEGGVSPIGTVTFEDVNITNSGTHSQEWRSAAVATATGGKVVINSGNYSSENWVVRHFSSGGDITINGGTFSGKIKAHLDKGSYSQYPAIITINGGTFNNCSLEVEHNNGDTSANIVIYGGTFDCDPSAYVANGYEAVNNGNGTWTVQKLKGVAQIGSSYYATLAEAVAASKDGDTIVLITDCDVTSTINVDHSLTLDLNGKIVTNKTSQTRAFFVNAKSFTVEGNNGKMVTPEECDNYGFVDLKVAAALVVKNTTFEGATHAGAFIKARNSAEVTLTNVNATTMLCGSQEAATANYNSLGVNSIVSLSPNHIGVLNVTGGTYNHNSWKAKVNGAPLGFAFDSEQAVASFKDVTINSNVGTIVSAYASDFENCSLTGAETAGTSWASTAIGLAHSSYGNESHSSWGEFNRKDNNIKSGAYSGRYAVAIWSSGSQLNISGGTFIGSEASVAVIGDNGSDADSFEVNISGGSFTGPIHIDSNNRAKITITGGTFNSDPSAYVAAGYEAVHSGNNWKVQVKNYTCTVYTPSTSLSGRLDAPVVSRVRKDEAVVNFGSFSNLETGQVIELTEDVYYNGTVSIPAGVVLDFNGHKLTATKVRGLNGNAILQNTLPYNDGQPNMDAYVNVSYEGDVENVEIRGGTYTFNPQTYTPSGIGVVVDGKSYNAPGLYFVPSIPEALVYYADYTFISTNLGEVKIGYNGSFGKDADGNISSSAGTFVFNDIKKSESINDAFIFQMNPQEEYATSQSYNDWICDYVVSVKEGEKGTPEEPGLGLWGMYGGMTVGFGIGFNLAANEKYPLISSLGFNFDYTGIKTTVSTFICGTLPFNNDLIEKTVYVDLCLFPAEGFDSSKVNKDQNYKYIVVKRFVYKFAAE